MVQTAAEARHRNPPPRFPSEKRKSEAASGSESSDQEQALSSDDEAEEQRVEVYTVPFAIFCKPTTPCMYAS